MATKLENCSLEKSHFLNFKKYIPRIEEMDEDTISLLLDMGLLQVSTAAEYAMSNVSNTTVVSTDTNDLSNGDDVKLSTVRTSGYGKKYSAPITNIKGKTGNLRVQVYERKLDKFYYFVIPYATYKDIPSKSNIEIPFYLNGMPRRIPSRSVYVNWWNYEVDSFVEAANAVKKATTTLVRPETGKRNTQTLTTFANLFDLA
jgi:hypothetical protein